MILREKQMLCFNLDFFFYFVVHFYFYILIYITPHNSKLKWKRTHAIKGNDHHRTPFSRRILSSGFYESYILLCVDRFFFFLIFISLLYFVKINSVKILQLVNILGSYGSLGCYGPELSIIYFKLTIETQTLSKLSQNNYRFSKIKLLMSII